MPHDISKLRDALVKTFEDVQNGKLPPNTANSLANTASKIMATVKLEIDYNKAKKKAKTIKYLENDN